MSRFTYVTRSKRRVRETEEPATWPRPVPRQVDSCTAEIIDVIDEVLGDG